MNILRQYPKLVGFLLSCVFAYGMARNGAFDGVVHLLNGHGYLSTFIGGMLYTFGFTAPFGVGILSAASPYVNPVQAAIIGGGGAVIADMAIFSFAAISLHDEIVRLSVTKVMLRVRTLIFRDSMNERVRRWALWALSAVLIGSPLPDEIGVTILGGITMLSARQFAVIAYVLNTLGILTILLLSRS